jgi:hypothetical protein
MVLSGIKKTLAILLLGMFGVGFAAVALELAVRLFVPVSDFFWESDPVLGVKLVANKRGRSVKPGLFDVPVEINSHGFRDREHFYEKPAGTQRIVMLGDSYIEALQVPLERTVAALLETRLRHRGIRAETINLGVSAFGTGREYLMLREHGLRYEPDLVLLFFVGNDLLNNSARLEGTPYVPYPVLNGNRTLSRDEAGEPRFTPIVDAQSRLSFMTGFLKEYSKGYRFLRMIIQGSPSVHEIFYRLGLMSTAPATKDEATNAFGLYEIYRIVETDALIEAWTVTEQLLRETKRMTEKNGARFAVVLVPAPWEVYPELWEAILNRVPAMRQVALDPDKPSRRLTSFLHAHRIAYVDLLPGFRERARSSALFFQPDNHWTADGHLVAADLVVDSVASLLKDH